MLSRVGAVGSLAVAHILIGIRDPSIDGNSLVGIQRVTVSPSLPRGFLKFRYGDSEMVLLCDFLHQMISED